MPTKRSSGTRIALAAGSVVALALSGCAGQANPEPSEAESAASQVSASPAPATTAPATSATAQSASQGVSTNSPKPAPSFTTNVPPPDQHRPDKAYKDVMTPAGEKETIQKISAYTGVPADQYDRLDMDKTFMASNNQGFTWWVGTKVIPTLTSESQKSAQGANSYFLIHYDQHGNFDVFPVGKEGYDEPNRCAAVQLPDSIRELWGWSPTDCPPF